MALGCIVGSGRARQLARSSKAKKPWLVINALKNNDLIRLDNQQTPIRFHQ